MILRTHTQAVLDEVAHRDGAVPSRFGGRRFESHHMRLLQLSSAASSQVMTRSSRSIKFVSVFSSVVLPEPVPPEIRTLHRTRPMSLAPLRPLARSN